MRRCAELPHRYRKHHEVTAIGALEVPQGVTDAELGWLAGFVDGEGTLFFLTGRRSGGRVRFKAAVDIANTDTANTDRVSGIIEAVTGAGPRAVVTNVAKGYRPCYSLRLRGQLRIALLLHAMLPYLVGKRRRAELLLEFIETAPRSALAGRATERRRTEDNMRWASGYTARHFEIVEEVRRLNRRYRRGEWATENSTVKP